MSADATTTAATPAVLARAPAPVAVAAAVPRPGRVRAVRFGARSAAALALVTFVGLAAFFWPFVADPGSAAVAHAADAPWVFALVLPLVLAVLLAEVADGALDAKGVAMLGVLAAVGTALRPLGAGLGGFEPVWLVIVLGGRALGPGFGFALGSVTMFSSALVTAGVGPWLPFQMLAAGWVGLGAGLLPPRRGRLELVMLAAYGAVAAVAYGFVMNLWFWPFVTGTDGALSFVPGAPVSENLQHWLVFSLATGLGFDLPRAVLTAVLVLVAGRPVLTALRRATRRAAFDVPAVFTPATPATPTPPHASRGDDPDPRITSAVSGPSEALTPGVIRGSGSLPHPAGGAPPGAGGGP